MTPQRKPIRSIGENGPRCYCNQVESEHPTADCKVFQQRPCVCGHTHSGTCRECTCRKYQEDRTPEFLMRAGIRNGEWGILPLPRLGALMRPENDPDVRIWACVMVHLAGRRGKGRSGARLAMMLDENGKTLVPLSPAAIVKELNALDTVPRLDKHGVRKALRENERRGTLRVVGNKRNQIRIFGYTRPLVKRELPSIPDPDFGGLSRPPEGVNPGDLNYLRTRILLPVRKMLVKTFSKTLREELQSLDLKGGNSDPQELIEKVVDEVVLGVELAYQKLREGVSPEPQSTPVLNKERARGSNPSSSSDESGIVGRSVEEVGVYRPTDSLAVIRELPWLKKACKKLNDQPGDDLCHRILVKLRGAPPSSLDDRIQLRFKAITSLGLIEGLANDVGDAWVKDAAERERISAAANAAQKLADKRAIENAWNAYRDPSMSNQDRQLAREVLESYGVWSESEVVS